VSGSNYVSLPSVLIMRLDVEIHHLETAHPLEFSNISIIEHGPLRASVRAEVKYDKSIVSLTVSWLPVIIAMIFLILLSRLPWMPPVVCKSHE
jgi:hypothetical protein